MDQGCFTAVTTSGNSERFWEIQDSEVSGLGFWESGRFKDSDVLGILKDSGFPGFSRFWNSRLLIFWKSGRFQRFWDMGLLGDSVAFRNLWIFRILWILEILKFQRFWSFKILKFLALEFWKFERSECSGILRVLEIQRSWSIRILGLQDSGVSEILEFWKYGRFWNSKIPVFRSFKLLRFWKSERLWEDSIFQNSVLFGDYENSEDSATASLHFLAPLRIVVLSILLQGLLKFQNSKTAWFQSNLVGFRANFQQFPRAS